MSKGKLTTSGNNDADKVDEYRQKLINMIANNEEIFNLVADKGAVFGEDDLIWSNIFPMEFVLDTTETAKTFVCVDIDVAYNDDNPTFDYMDIYIFVATHKNTFKNPKGKGLRVDAIAHLIRTMLDRELFSKLGANRVQFVSNRRYNPSMVFRGRVLQFRLNDFRLGV